jgi:hypothetical protein
MTTKLKAEKLDMDLMAELMEQKAKLEKRLVKGKSFAVLQAKHQQKAKRWQELQPQRSRETRDPDSW